jgi:transposase
MLGLLVGESGYPIGYDIFEGNTFEGHTLLPTIKKIQKKYGFAKPVVVADAALLNKDNLEDLSKEEYFFIIGGRIKNETDKIKQKILKKAKRIKEKGYGIFRRADNTRLIVTYSPERAKKDAHNREKGVEKLKKRVKSGKLTKENINNKGFNKFLNLRMLFGMV